MSGYDVIGISRERDENATDNLKSNLLFVDNGARRQKLHPHAEAEKGIVLPDIARCYFRFVQVKHDLESVVIGADPRSSSFAVSNGHSSDGANTSIVE